MFIRDGGASMWLLRWNALPRRRLGEDQGGLDL